MQGSAALRCSEGPLSEGSPQIKGSKGEGRAGSARQRSRHVESKVQRRPDAECVRVAGRGGARLR